MTASGTFPEGLLHITCLFNHFLQMSHFLFPWKEVKMIMLPKPGKDQNFTQNLHLISLLSTTVKLFVKSIDTQKRRTCYMQVSLATGWTTEV